MKKDRTTMSEAMASLEPEPHPLTLCAKWHQQIADSFEYKSNFDTPEAMLHAQQMTDMMKWQHGRWAELIRLAVIKDASRD